MLDELSKVRYYFRSVLSLYGGEGGLKKEEALLVIDIDQGDEWFHDHDSGNFADSWVRERQPIALRIVEMLKKWRQVDKTVIFVVFVDPEEMEKNRLAQLTDDDSLHRCLVCDLLPDKQRLAKFLGHRHGESYEPVFLKNNHDAFTNSILINALRAWGISKVFLAGCLTFNCVLETAKGALRSGISVTLIRDCVYPEFNKQDVTEVAWLNFVVPSVCQKASVSIE